MLKISSSSDAQPLTNEQLVGLKCKLEDNITWFLKMLSLLESREIGVITSRILHMANKESDLLEKRSLLLKVELLHSYYEMRHHRQREFNSTARFREIENPKTFLQKLIDAKLVPAGLKLDEIPNQSDVNESVLTLSK